MTKNKKNSHKKRSDPFDHAWQYFSLHANQRISLVRYFIIFFSLYITAAGYLLVRFPCVGIIEELSVIVLSIVFVSITKIFKHLDARNCSLIHLAEESLREIEVKHKFDGSECIFNKEKDYTYKNDPVRHTHCFNWIFRIAYATACIILFFSIFQIIRENTFCAVEILKSCMCFNN